MKVPLFLLAIASTTSATVISGVDNVSKLLESARRLNQGEGEEQDIAWVADFSVKYQGCHHIKQWNDQANGQDDVRIFTKRLVRFRLCPSDVCSASAAAGCQTGYGDYIVDMETFLNMYWKAKEQDKEIGCQNYVNEFCAAECESANDDQVCEYDCLFDAGLEECIDGNKDQEGEGGRMNVEEFLQCQKLNVGQGENANANVDYDQDGNQIVYYVGPYCSEQGGAVNIGVFTDDQCTEFAGKTFYQITGQELAYTDKSIVEEGCRSCKELEKYGENDQNNQNNGNDVEDVDETREMCEQLYSSSGKCESKLANVIGSSAINMNACNYMSGIKMVRVDGLLDISDARPSAVATAFIVIFAMAFAAMAFYVWYLRTRLRVKKNSFL